MAADLPKNKVANQIYKNLNIGSKPDYELFEKAYLGYIDLVLDQKLAADCHILSLVDFRLPSNEKRLWIIDLEEKKVLFNTYVAHGENSGKAYAINFSNTINSKKSSLGYYKTADTYTGKNGLSLRLIGLENGINNNAQKRYIVLHGATYATKAYIDQQGTLGNSEGCPAVPMGTHLKIIEKAKGGSCLFMYAPNLEYSQKSKYFLGIEN